VDRFTQEVNLLTHAEIYWLVANIGLSRTELRNRQPDSFTGLLEVTKPDRAFHLRRANLCRPHSSPILDRQN
jgi:hypothetical protein